MPGVRSYALVFLAAITLYGHDARFASAHSTASPQACLNLSVRSEITIGTQDLGLTVAQIKELRSRLSQYWRPAGWPGLDGFGLTPGQIATIKARIAADVAKQQKHPLGWPCLPFKHRARTLAFVRALLLGNGFASYSIRFYGSAPRQLQFGGVLNGQQYSGAVARSGVRQITLQLTSTGAGTTQVFATPFDA